MIKAVFTSTVATVVLVCAAPARAELVFFSTGRTMSVKSHRADGDSLVLTLRSGGEIACDASTIARIAPDEVPYPEPEEVRLKPDSTQESGGVPLQADLPYGEIIAQVAAAQRGNAQLRAAHPQPRRSVESRRPPPAFLDAARSNDSRGPAQVDTIATSFV